eukprot:6078453-Ditylum_brightwellii.AAC.1
MQKYRVKEEESGSLLAFCFLILVVNQRLRWKMCFDGGRKKEGKTMTTKWTSVTLINKIQHKVLAAMPMAVRKDKKFDGCALVKAPSVPLTKLCENAQTK